MAWHSPATSPGYGSRARRPRRLRAKSRSYPAQLVPSPNPAAGLPADRGCSVIAIFGPTAVGKTEVAIEVAELLRARGEQPVAVSADAIQVYEGLDTLAAKPSAAE